MKIAIFTDTYKPMVNGVIVSIDNLSKNLIKRGHDVEIFTVKIRKKPIPPKGVKMHYHNGMVLPTLKDLKIATPNTLNILKKLKKFNPDIIHSMTCFGMGLQAYLCSKFLDVPLVYTEHAHIVDFTRYISMKEVNGIKKIELLFKLMIGTNVNFLSIYSYYLLSYYKSPEKIKIIENGVNGIKVLKKNKKKKVKMPYFHKLVWRYLYFFYNNADLITTPSEAMKKIMRKQGVKQKIVVVSNGIDRRLFNKQKTKKSDEFKIIHVGRISWEKNIEVILKAFLEVLKKHPNVKFEICGTGPQLKEIKDLAKKHKVRDRIKFMGLVKHADLPKHYSSSHLFVTASTIETEGIVMLEAMSCGLPVIAVNKLACPFVVKHEKNGFIAPAGNYKRIAYYINKLIDDKKLLESMGKESIKLSKEYDLKKVVDKWENIYSKLKEENMVDK